jgi:uncharacterized membrane protein HdeD (DUF308 family)
MLAALAVDWGFLMLRAWLALLFGVIVLVWPELRSTTLVWIFGAYALADGALAMLVALDVKDWPGVGSLLFESVVRLGVGMFVLAAPARASLALVNVFAVWAVLSGVAAFLAHLAMRRRLRDEWQLPFIGAVSVLVGVMLLFGPGTPPELEWVVGPTSMLFGLTLLALVQRLRRFAPQFPNTAAS